MQDRAERAVGPKAAAAAAGGYRMLEVQADIPRLDVEIVGTGEDGRDTGKLGAGGPLRLKVKARANTLRRLS
jgi:hypothetical protein